VSVVANIYVDIDGLYFWRVSDNGQVLAVGPRRGTRDGAIESFGTARQAMRNVDLITYVNEDNIPAARREVRSENPNRWNPIDKDGNVIPDVVVPPDPNTGGDDEGETGPPMVDLTGVRRGPELKAGVEYEVVGDQILGSFAEDPK
jgi:hypothetical protein